MAAIEEMALFGGRLSDLLKGKTSQEVAQLIGEPRITTGTVKGWNDSVTNQQNSLYFFGFNSLSVCVTYSKNICVLVNRVQYEAFPIEEAAFKRLKAFSLGKPPAEIAKYLQHDLTSTKDIGIRTFSVGQDREWTFHFENGKCVDVCDSVLL